MLLIYKSVTKKDCRAGADLWFHGQTTSYFSKVTTYVDLTQSLSILWLKLPNCILQQNLFQYQHNILTGCLYWPYDNSLFKSDQRIQNSSEQAANSAPTFVILYQEFWTNLCYTTLQPFNSLFSRTKWINSHHKGKPFWIIMKQEMMGWQWHQLDHMQIIYTLLQKENHASTSSLQMYPK